MMVEKILKISLSSLMILLLSSCSIAGSWVYERLDGYLADYFKEFADFSKEQNQEIELISEEFLNWFSENELLKIKLIIEDLKNIDAKKPEEKVASAYTQGEEIFKRVNDFFARPIINFSKGLKEDQINQIDKHFKELRKEREEERKKEKEEYKDRLLENYISGFDRIGIDLRDDQLETIKIKLENHIEVRKEWSELQQNWINEFVQLLKRNNSYGYESRMLAYLDSLEELGNEEFRDKIEKNEMLSMEIISFVFLTSDDRQIQGFKRSLDIYLKSINRILSNRKVN
tara:strand:+ start:46 stop:906 length:861 start_codon:yes stop_codon:yes gene_type:complete